MQFYATKNFCKLSLNIDHVYCIYITVFYMKKPCTFKKLHPHTNNSTSMNSQRENTNSNGCFLLKNRVETFVLKILVYKNRYDSDLV